MVGNEAISSSGIVVAFGMGGTREGATKTYHSDPTPCYLLIRVDHSFTYSSLPSSSLSHPFSCCDPQREPPRLIVLTQHLVRVDHSFIYSTLPSPVKTSLDIMNPISFHQTTQAEHNILATHILILVLQRYLEQMLNFGHCPNNIVKCQSVSWRALSYYMARDVKNKNMYVSTSTGVPKICMRAMLLALPLQL